MIEDKIKEYLDNRKDYLMANELKPILAKDIAEICEKEYPFAVSQTTGNEPLEGYKKSCSYSEPIGNIFDLEAENKSLKEENTNLGRLLTESETIVCNFEKLLNKDRIIEILKINMVELYHDEYETIAKEITGE